MKTEEFLKRAGVRYEKHEHPITYTAQELAAAEHVTGDAVAKSVLVQADGKNVLCVLPASHKIDLGKLAKVLRARKCRLVDEAEMARLFPEAEVGAEGPFGKPYGLKTLVDQHLAERDVITFTADSHRQAIRIDYADYARLAEPAVADFSAHL